MKISVILPIYNQELYLDNIFDSLFSQTYDEYEIVAVNDGSTDSSRTILKKYEKDARVTVVNQENAGSLAATATGVSVASGEYVYFVDADDIVGNNYLQNFVNELDHEYDFVAMGFSYRYGNKAVAHPLAKDRVYTKSELMELSKNYIVDDHLHLDNKIFIARWNKIYKRQMLLKILDEWKNLRGICYGDDTIFTFLMLQNSQNGKAVMAVNEYQYVQHEQSMTHTPDLTSYADRCRNVCIVYQGLLKKYRMPQGQAYLLFYALVSGVLSTSVETCAVDAPRFYRELVAMPYFNDALRVVDAYCHSRNANVWMLRHSVPYWVYRTARRFKAWLHQQ